jgi:hypothetical protein
MSLLVEMPAYCSMMRGNVALLAVAVVAMACSPGAQVVASPTPQVQTTPEPTASVVSSPTATPTATPFPNATPVERTLHGRASLVTSGAGVPGVRVRAMPSPINLGASPGPDVTGVSGTDGTYAFTVFLWTPEALASSSSEQLMVDIVPPPGLRVIEVTRSNGAPPGTPATGPYFVRDLDGPIDITLERAFVVEGKVTSATGAPRDGIGVTALGLNSIIINGGSGDAFEVQARASTDATGRYRLTVPSGTYVIHVGGPDGVRFWTDDPAVFQPTPLKVERDLAGIDITLAPVTTIWGQVRTGPSYVEGLEGVRVVAYLGGGSACCRIVGVATTGYIGTFVLHVPPGRYRIAFEPPAGSPYATQWWSGAAAFAAATDLTLGQTRVQLEVELARARP